MPYMARPGARAGRRARAELAAVAYQPNLLGTKGPRKMTVLIPRLDAAGRRTAFRPSADGPRGGMLDKCASETVLPARVL